MIALAASASAAAQSAPPQDISGVDQYEESVPGSGGSVVRPQDGGGQPLPPDVEGMLQSEGGADVARLSVIATSPRFGAPTKPLNGNFDDTSGSLRTAVAEPRVLALVLFLTLTTAVAAATAVYRHNPPSA